MRQVFMVDTNKIGIFYQVPLDRTIVTQGFIYTGIIISHDTIKTGLTVIAGSIRHVFIIIVGSF